MTIDPISAQIILAIIVNIPIWVLMRANFRKTNTDAYESLATALHISGQTIDDLFKQLAEMPALKAQLDAMEAEIEDLRLGVGILTTQLLKRNIEPEWHPRAVKGFAVKPVNPTDIFSVLIGSILLGLDRLRGKRDS
jgi:hypothetical protein